MTIEVRVNYFALFREIRGLASESCLTDASTLAELYDELRCKYGFNLSRQILRVAKNDELSDWDERLNSGDRIVFIPPVAGG